MTAALTSVSLGSLGQPSFDLLADSSVVLVLLAAAFLVFRTFRELYLLTWILGWTCYLLYRVTGAPDISAVAVWPRVLAHLAFVAAVALLVSALLFYTQRRRRFLALAILTALTAAVGLTRALWLPDSAIVAWTFRGLYTLMALLGAVELARFSRGRHPLGAWMTAVTLVLLHFDDFGSAGHLLAGTDMALELMLGLGMLVIVLDDSRTRTERLAAVNIITATIAQARDHGEIVLTALEQMKKLLAARAAWYRTLKGSQLVITQQIGVSENLLREHALLELSGNPERIVQAGKPVILRTDAADTPNGEVLRGEGFRHQLIIPVKGKSSVLGAFCLVQTHHREYPPDELRFLTVLAHQIGIAIENLELLQQILRSHRQWVRTVDAIEDSILVHDEQFRVLRVNRALMQRLPIDNYGDLVLRRCEEILPGAGERWRQCPYCASGAEFTEGLDPAFGGFSIVTSSSFADEGGRLTGTIHIIRDTTDRRAAEEKYRLLFEQAQEGVFVSTPAGRLEDCNDAFVRMLGYESREQVLALDVSSGIYAQAGLREAFLQAIAQQGFVRNFEVELRRRDGSVISALENSFAERDASGKIVRYQGFLLDISEIKRAQNEIRRRNRELHTLNAIAVVGAQSFDLDEIVNNTLRQVVALFATDTGGVWLLDPAGSGNLRRYAAHGHRQVAPLEAPVETGFVEALRQDRREIITERHLPQLPAFARRFVETESLVAYVWVIMWSKDQPIGVLGVGSRSPREFGATDLSLLVAIGRQVATTIEKVRLFHETRRAYDDLQHTQEQLLQSEKMSAIGQLVSGVAHELNNPLTAILGYAELLQGEPLDERALDFVGKLVKQAQRTQRLVQNLLSFSRQRKPEKKLVDVRRVLEDTIALRDYDFKRRNIVVCWQFQPDVPPVLGDAHQIEQVFLNIINNAADAMLEPNEPGMDTGRLSVAEVDSILAEGPAKPGAAGPLRPARPSGPHRITVSLHSESGRVCAEFHDSGPGIREPKKVFDPFYTTKRVGKGTGLGLSICYGIIKEHGGEISAANAPEGGALFRVVLPAAQEHQATAPASAAPERAATRELRGRVLIVEEEESVREAARAALSDAGAEVVTVSSGPEALARLECERFDAVLLDTSMPGPWNGLSIYDWLAENRSGAEKGIILTASDISELEAHLARSAPCLVKPLQVPELLAAIKSVLARRSAASAG